MGNCLWEDKAHQYETKHLGWLSFRNSGRWRNEYQLSGLSCTSLMR